jgi:hypothetical protein
MGKGFVYNANTLEELIRVGYYANQRRTTRLAPQEVAESLAAALVALSKVCTTAMDKSVFFGTTDFRQQPMQDAFILAALSRLATCGVPGSWEGLLNNLKFNSANWNFKTWVVQLDGNYGNRSRDLATRCLTSVFDAGNLGTGMVDIPTHLKGDNASVTVTLMQIGSGGRALRATAVDETYPVSRIGVHTFAQPGTHKLWLKETSTNVNRIEAWDSSSPRETFSRSKLMQPNGMLLEQPSSDSREIVMKVEYYGGVEEQLRLTLNW